MAQLMYKPRTDLTDSQYLHLSVYCIYVTNDKLKVASLFNQIQRPRYKIATQEVEETFRYLRRTQHAMLLQAKDMNRNDPDRLRRILRDEVGMREAIWNVRVVQPVIELAELRPAESR